MANYLRSSRSAFYGVIAALPLLLAYELLLLVSGSIGGWQVRNAGDVWLRLLLESLDVGPTHASAVMILILLLAIPAVRRRDTPLRGTYCVLMVAEAFCYSLMLGLLINIILEFIFSAIPSVILSRALFPAAMPFAGDTARGLALSLGAGLFEEFIFRVVLLGGLLLLMRLVLPHHLATVVAIVLAALLFSAAHYIGPLGDHFTFASFLFRFVAGLLFTGLYYLRGFGVTAYAHAFYDMRVLLF
ncbi:MAG TPA: CPBP family glutamic-type intramembrane protease [bacterium]|nr:CPBP family glutamic-type intramembrane protease [bacterium]